MNGTCYAAAKTSLCTGNGEVELRFGSPEYVGLGALVFLLLVLLETFGSPFMRNCEVSCDGILSYCHSLVLHLKAALCQLTSCGTETCTCVTVSKSFASAVCTNSSSHPVAEG